MTTALIIGLLVAGFVVLRVVWLWTYQDFSSWPEQHKEVFRLIESDKLEYAGGWPEKCFVTGGDGVTVYYLEPVFICGGYCYNDDTGLSDERYVLLHIRDSGGEVTTTRISKVRLYFKLRSRMTELKKGTK